MSSGLSPEEQKEEWYNILLKNDSEIDKANKQIGRLTNTNESLEEKNIELTEKLNELKNKRDKNNRSKSKKTSWSSYLTYIDKIIDVIKNTDTELVELIKNETAHQTTLILKQLVKDPQNWDKIIIDEYNNGWIVDA